MNITKGKLDDLLKAYLDTLRTDYKDDWYGTERELSEAFCSGFVKFLKQQ